MKKIAAAVLGICMMLSLASTFTVFAASEYKAPVILVQNEDVYSVDYVFKIEGEGKITEVTATDSSCLLDWNYVQTEARLYISLASANPLSKSKKIAEVESTGKIKLTAESLKVNGVPAEPINYISGDVNSDGNINKTDSLLLKKYLAGHSVDINVAAADVNIDGYVNKTDSLLLKKYLAGHNITLGE